MAVIAGITTSYMGRILAGRSDTVVARATGADDLNVVNGVNRRPHVGVMAIFADIAGLDVGKILASRIGAVVAVDAAVRNIRVIEVRG